MKLRYHYDNDASESYEAVDPISVTVPDQTMSIKEIFQRTINGVLDPSTLQRGGIYDDEPDVDVDYPTDSQDFDIIDAFAYQSNIQKQSNDNSTNNIVSNDNVEPSAPNISQADAGQNLTPTV